MEGPPARFRCHPDIRQEVRLIKNVAFTVYVLDQDDGTELLLCPWQNNWEKPVFSESSSSTPSYHSIVVKNDVVVRQPRLTLVYDKSYQYNGSIHRKEETETPTSISQLYQIVLDLFDEHVNMTLVNAYMHGMHSIAKHSDDEAQMGGKKHVFCFSVGASRRAVFRCKKDPEKILDLLIPEGLYVMWGSHFQERWTHEFPKMRSDFGAYVLEHECPKSNGKIARADWAASHPDVIMERLKHSPPLQQEFQLWLQPRYSFTLRFFDRDV